MLSIPVYQPTYDLIKLLEDINNLNFIEKKNIIIIDDGSNIDTSIIILNQIKNNGYIVYKNNFNRGKGFAIKKSINIAKSFDAKFIVTADGDGQHDSNDIKNIYQYGLKNNIFCLGVRGFDKNTPFKNKFSNIFIRFLVKIFFKLKCSDTQTGLRLIPKFLFDELINIKENRYDYEMMALIKVYELHYTIKEIEISTIYNKNQVSHFKNLTDSCLILLALLRIFFKKTINN